jgi:hypothetical protein
LIIKNIFTAVLLELNPISRKSKFEILYLAGRVTHHIARMLITRVLSRAYLCLIFMLSHGCRLLITFTTSIT